MSQEKSKDMSQHFFRASAADFMKIPGSPVAYWVSSAARLAFLSKNSIDKIFKPRKGIDTGNNERFLRHWYEVSIENIGFNCKSESESSKSNNKWFPYNKGGDFRKWYGNFQYVVDWKGSGESIRNHKDDSGKIRSNLRNQSFFFKEGVTWTDVSSSSFGARYLPYGFMCDNAGSACYGKSINLPVVLGMFTSKVAFQFLKILNPTLHFQAGNISSLPLPDDLDLPLRGIVECSIASTKSDWDSYETSWEFTSLQLLTPGLIQPKLKVNYQRLLSHWREITLEMQRIEEENNRLFIDAYGLQDELTTDVPLNEITLTCNPHYRYGGNRSEEELETLQQCDTLRELVSYAIGCMMGRYSFDKPGLILASQGETLQDYLQQIPSPRFAPDSDAILPLTDQEWFADDATNRFRELVRVVWGDDHLQENLDFVAESLCLHAIKPKRGESALDTIRRYLSTQFFKDHLRIYKKRPIYWLFSSGKHKAFECLVYLHRYNEGTLARMRTEYVIPLSAKLNSYAEKLEQDRDASTSAAETKRLSNELSTLHKQQAELAEFDEKLRHYADQRISLDLDDGVKVNYGKFGDLLAEVKAVTGGDK
jgi:type II restriction/modification system DNA methylase subunit YeeA